MSGGEIEITAQDDGLNATDKRTEAGADTETEKPDSNAQKHGTKPDVGAAADYHAAAWDSRIQKQAFIFQAA